MVACGVDIGSTNVKVVLMNAEGAVVARERSETPRDSEGLSIDVTSLLQRIDAMILAACSDAWAVCSVSVAGIGEDGVLVDEDLNVLTDALSWFDPRRQGVYRGFRKALHDDDLYDASSDASRTMTGWKWSRGQVRASGAAHWLAVADLPTALWASRPFMSDTLASRTGAWRTRDRSWARDRVELTLGTTDLLPPVLRAGEVVGEFRSQALQAAGVLADAAVSVAGGHDHPLGGWGVDQLTPGAVLDSMGTAEVVVLQADSEQASRREGVDIAPGIRSDGRTLMRVEELARNVAWASQDPEVAFQIRALMVGKIEPDPVLNAGYFHTGRRGGGRPSYALDAPRDPLARASAVLGALALAGGEAIEAVKAEVPQSRTVRTAGGWARSVGWLRIKAAVTGYDAEPVVEPEVTAVSAALLAAYAYGWDPDPARVFAEPGA
nr:MULTISPECIES: FGGY family carbohydrate kinase [Microbacterium]